MRWKNKNGTIELSFMGQSQEDTTHLSDLFQKALAFYQADQLQEAETIYYSIIQNNPQHPYPYHFLGLIAHERNQHEIATKLIDKAIQIDPTIQDFYNNCGIAFLAMQEDELAMVRFRQALAINPDFAVAHNNMGVTYNKMNRLEDSISCYKQAIKHKHDYDEAYSNMGTSFMGLNRLKEAIDCFTKALEINPTLVNAHDNLGNVFAQVERTEEAVECYKKALAINPDFAEGHNNLGNVYRKIGKMDKAITCFQKAVSINKELDEAYNNLGIVLQDLGRIEEAIECYKSALAIKPDRSEAHRNLILVKPSQEHISIIEDLIINSNPSEDDLVHYHFALGDVFYKKKSFTKAFDHFFKANSLKRKSIKYNPDDTSNFVNRLIGVFSEDYFLDKAVSVSDSELPVFIVGMPRSGTTLVEQIISSHPQVYGAGELPLFPRIINTIEEEFGDLVPYPECMPKYRDIIADKYSVAYLERIKNYSEVSDRISDKLPDNFLRIGLIKTLFPKARIIHCQRNALDTCLSIFLKYFVYDIKYTFDLTDIGRYYLDYEKLMSHWHNLFPSEMLDVQYENLVMSQEEETKRLIEYLGLEWNDQCLNFYENKRAVSTASNIQVRKPMYKNSIYRWKQHEEYLGPLMDILKHHI